MASTIDRTSNPQLQFTWRGCAKWLEQCKVLRTDAYPPDAQVVHFAHSLRDGVLLCHLITRLDPEALDFRDVCLRPQMAQCMCLKNIRIFLQACRRHFDLKEADLFDPAMLYDYSDFGKVLRTLSKLSKCPKIARLGYEGFNVTDHSDEEKIYDNLEDLEHEELLFRDHNSENEDENRHVSSLVSYRESLYDDNYYSLTDENIYEDLCSFRKSLTSPQATSAPPAPMDKREYAIRELVETEKNYLKALDMIRNCFLRPLTAVLSSEERKCIFFGIEKLYEIHSRMNDDLVRATSVANGLKLHSVFLTWKEKLLIYGDVCSNLPNAQQMIDEVCNKNRIAAEELRRCQDEAMSGKHFELKDLLTLPMQRVLKYHLLLKELLKHTGEVHEDYLGVQSAYEAMLDVSSYVNEVKRDNEMLQIISDVQESISGWNPEMAPLKEYGRLIKDGELKIRSHEDGNRQKLRYVFVFNRAVIFCKTNRGEPYSFRNCLLLENYKLEDYSKRTLGRTEPGRWQHQWLLVDNQNKTAITLYAKSLEAKNKWIRALSEAMELLHPPECRTSEHSCTMHTFTQTTSCDVCKKLLKGAFYQGYKCGPCGVAAHKECLAKLPQGCGAPLPPPRPGLIPPPYYPNEEMESKPWFAGQMNRQVAEQLLWPAPQGAFMLRKNENGFYAISLKTNRDEVKHMKVLRNMADCYFLSEAFAFHTVTELVVHYEHNSLQEAFRGLDAVLARPWKKLFHTARVVGDYIPNDQNSQMLPIIKGQHIVIVSREGDSTGWWKGRYGGDEGYFPKDYVEEDHFYQN